MLDAYPLPHMQDIVRRIAQYKVYSTLDLIIAYHQVELPSSNRLFASKLMDLYGNGKEYLSASQTLFHAFNESSTISLSLMDTKVFFRI